MGKKDTAYVEWLPEGYSLGELAIECAFYVSHSNYKAGHLEWGRLGVMEGFRDTRTERSNRAATVTHLTPPGSTGTAGTSSAARQILRISLHLHQTEENAAINGGVPIAVRSE